MTIIKRFIQVGLILILLMITHNLVSDEVINQQYSELDKLITSQMKKHNLKGISLSIVDGNEISYSKGYGKTAKGKSMTQDTKMFIGSVSKSFTALAIAKLVDEGKLSFEDPVQTHIKWFRTADEEASKKITINTLLRHTSGLSEAGYSVYLPNNTSLEEAVRSLKSAKLTAGVGEKHQYFNMGYTILGYIIEVVSGQKYCDYIDEKILQPLGMKNSSANPEKFADFPEGNTRLFGFNFPMRQPIPKYGIPAGYIISTADDMAKYALAMKDINKSIVSPEIMKQMFKPGPGSYGYGWGIYDSGTKISHGGANETFHTSINIYPFKNKAFVLLINQGYQVDHFISGPQIKKTIESFLLDKTKVPISEGWPVVRFGWFIGLITLILLLLRIKLVVGFKKWKVRALKMSKVKLITNIAFSFIIPTLIFFLIITQIKGFYGYRFNLIPTMIMMPIVLPDIFILMIVGILPDYIEGIFKIISYFTGIRSLKQ